MTRSAVHNVVDPVGQICTVSTVHVGIDDILAGLHATARITASSGPLPGNASLIIRTETDAGQPPQVSYNLYADGREVAAARYAATGDLSAARVRMANASPNLGLGLSPAARKSMGQGCGPGRRDPQAQGDHRQAHPERWKSATAWHASPTRPQRSRNVPGRQHRHAAGTVPAGKAPPRNHHCAWKIVTSRA
jgi:hypothetical protein